MQRKLSTTFSVVLNNRVHVSGMKAKSECLLICWNLKLQVTGSLIHSCAWTFAMRHFWARVCWVTKRQSNNHVPLRACGEVFSFMKSVTVVLTLSWNSAEPFGDFHNFEIPLSESDECGDQIADERSWTEQNLHVREFQQASQGKDRLFFKNHGQPTSRLFCKLSFELQILRSVQLQYSQQCRAWSNSLNRWIWSVQGEERKMVCVFIQGGVQRSNTAPPPRTPH